VQELETFSDDAHKEGEGEIVPREDGSQAQRQGPSNKKERTRSWEIPLEKLVLRLYHERVDLETTDRVRVEGYRELQKQFVERASPGQRAHWEKAQRDSRFREEEIPDEELVGYVIGGKEQDFPMGSNKSARWTEDGILLVLRPGHENESTERVVAGCVEPRARLLVDGEVYYRWSVDGREVTAKLDALLDQLHGEVAILSRRNASDVLSIVARGMIQTTEERHATYGIYPDGDKLVLCEEPLPVEDEQASAWEQVKEHVGRSVMPEEVQAYVEMLKCWHPYEVLPAIGAGLAAPFTPTLRQAHIFMPHIFHHAPEHDLGKSAVALMASWYLYGIGEISGEGIGSQFRLAAHLDSIALPLTVDEADRLKDSVLPIVKDSAERWTPAKRGTKERRMVHYHSRAVLIMTGNALPTENAAVLKRILTVRFDSSAERERRKKGAFVKAHLEGLKPIGFAAVKGYLAAHSNRAELLETIERYAHEIEKAREDWQSAQRPQAWAVVYLGLKALEELCQAVGVEWAAPSIEAFAKQVVEPVERSTWESRRTAVECIADWFEAWCATHKKRVEAGRDSYDEIQGKDGIWKEGTIGAHDETLEGVFITSAMLGIYNKQARLGERISTLKELAMQAADSAEISYNEVLEPKTGQVMKTKFGGRSKRAAFLPLSTRKEAPEYCPFVPSAEPVSQKSGDTVGDTGTSGMSPSSSEGTFGDIGGHYNVPSKEDILAGREIASGDTGTRNSTRAHKEPPPLSAIPGSGEHLPLEEPGEDGHPLEISEKFDRLRQEYPEPLLRWAIERSLEMRARGDVWTAYHLRSEGKRELPDLSKEIERLADEHFFDLLTITDYLHDRKKRASSSLSPQPGEEQPAPADVARASQSEGFKGGPQRQPEEGDPPP
jgi:hypothetical protein